MSGTKIESFMPFWFEGGLVSGKVLVTSLEVWLTRVVELYAARLKAPDLPLDAVLLRYDSQGIPIFTLHHRIGLSLRTWAETHELGLVISVGARAVG